MEKTLQQSIEKLNPAQKEAVLTDKGPMLIIAGAGSGKTSVLTTRIARLMSTGVPPERILALTFTKKAAEEMRSRIISMEGESARRITMGTFHSVFIRFLRPNASRLNFPESFTILDEDDALSCLKRVIEETVAKGWPEKERWSEEMKKEFKSRMTTYSPKLVRDVISACKNDLVTVEAYCSDANRIEADKASGRPLLGEIYRRYRDTCHRMCVMDFDDILLYTDMLLANNPDVLGVIAGAYDHILVDEYQDTNKAQYSILKRLTWLNKNICVVGDDSQSIYAFRGAKIENIFNFEKDYPGCKVVKLENNYRSCRNIVLAANNLISHNDERIPKVCFTDKEKGCPIVIKSTYNEKEEAQYVADSIAERHGGNGHSYRDFAVLFRTNAQSRAIEDALIKRRIPYVVYSGTAFFERAEVKDMMAYLKLSVNPHDDESFRRVANRPTRGLGDSAIRKIADVARAWNTSLWTTVNHPQFPFLGFPPKMTAAVEAFRTLLWKAIRIASEQPAYAAASAISDLCGLEEQLKAQGDEESLQRADNIRELVDAVRSYEEDNEARNATLDEESKEPSTVAGFIQNAMLLSNADTDDGTDDKVSLMTVHSAKGLEFDTVFITGLEEGLFPLSIEKTAFEREEERRLFYVAMTRAKNELILARAEKRMKFGQRLDTRPSVFLSELRQAAGKDTTTKRH